MKKPRDGRFASVFPGRVRRSGNSSVLLGAFKLIHNVVTANLACGDDLEGNNSPEIKPSTERKVSYILSIRWRTYACNRCNM